tara:strand:+ start:2267 stop:2599 length:333 start_codon:yes stop_codon:yes gene_type:complete
MSVKKIKDLIAQINAPNELRLVEVDLENNNLYYIWKATNSKLRNFDSRFEALRQDHSKFDVFINGQFIIENDYIFAQKDNDFYLYFKKANFDYALVGTDEIVIEGDLDRI